MPESADGCSVRDLVVTTLFFAELRGTPTTFESVSHIPKMAWESYVTCQRRGHGGTVEGMRRILTPI